MREFEKMAIIGKKIKDIKENYNNFNNQTITIILDDGSEIVISKQWIESRHSTIEGYDSLNINYYTGD